MNPRLQHHAVLAVLATACLVIAWVAGPPAAGADRLSIVSAYLCLFLLGVALWIGPLNAIHRGRPIANSYLRRDTGIWAALAGLVHFFLANALAMNYEYLGSYVDNPAGPPSPDVRYRLYSAGTILGYVIAVVFVILLALSNDWMVRRLGLKWWKRLQRASYLGFAFTCAHAFAFQVLETREAVWVAVVLAVTGLVLAGQVWGYARARLRRHAVATGG